jgi:hypothetical protein
MAQAANVSRSTRLQAEDNQDKCLDRTEPYYRNRARTERVTAEEASSPQARSAHLELAVRYIRAAEALYVSTREPIAPVEQRREAHPAIAPGALRPALRSAFPLPASGTFSDLLSLIE